MVSCLSLIPCLWTISLFFVGRSLKSEIVPIGAIENVDNLVHFMGCKVGALPMTYSGLPLGCARWEVEKSKWAWRSIDELRATPMSFEWCQSNRVMINLSGHSADQVREREWFECPCNDCVYVVSKLFFSPPDTMDNQATMSPYMSLPNTKMPGGFGVFMLHSHEQVCGIMLSVVGKDFQSIHC